MVDQLSSGDDEGTKLGQSALDKISFHGVTPVIQAAHIVDASVAHALSSTFSNTEANTALNALGVKINSILVVLENKGLKATS